MIGSKVFVMSNYTNCASEALPTNPPHMNICKAIIACLMVRFDDLTYFFDHWMIHLAI